MGLPAVNIGTAHHDICFGLSVYKAGGAMKPERARYDIPVEPKAGAVGAIAVFAFGVLWILMAFASAYMWTDADAQLAAAIGVAAIVLPMTVGFFMSELRHQRSGAFWFVLTAAVLTGALGAWAFDERDDFQNRMDLIAPDADIPGLDPSEG